MCFRNHWCFGDCGGVWYIEKAGWGVGLPWLEGWWTGDWCCREPGGRTTVLVVLHLRSWWCSRKTHETSDLHCFWCPLWGCGLGTSSLSRRTKQHSVSRHGAASWRQAIHQLTPQPAWPSKGHIMRMPIRYLHFSQASAESDFPLTATPTPSRSPVPRQLLYGGFQVHLGKEFFFFFFF